MTSYIDKSFAVSKGIETIDAGLLTVFIAGRKSPAIYSKIMKIDGSFRRPETINISADKTLYDLLGHFDLIVDKDWMETYPHFINDNKNSLILMKTS